MSICVCVCNYINTCTDILTHTHTQIDRGEEGEQRKRERGVEKEERGGVLSNFASIDAMVRCT